MPKIRVNDTVINYLDEGSGAPLIFVHGLGGNHHMFDPQIAYFKSKYRVIAVDLRGNGNSGKLTRPIHSILDRQSDDIAKVMEYLNIKRAVFCGTSFGGTHCFHFALRYPKRVAGLVISDSFSDTNIHGFIEGLIYSIHLITLWTNYLPRIWLSPLLKLCYRKWPVAQHYALEVAKRIRKHELVLQRLAILRIDYTKNLPQIRCPVLGIVGDNFPPYIRCMRRSIESIPCSALNIVEDSFDPTNLCQIDRYNDLVQVFLTKIEWQ
jgi:3-oxoadipate enol-lactonase